ncbi:MAG: hypothetical protein COB41_10900 [Proteobacteria bacterium]|nr:MAG: hypothetical protein COB41_10900 [Pseudomonadota bacterium]
MSNSNAIALFIQRGQGKKSKFDEIVRFFEVPYTLPLQIGEANMTLIMFFMVKLLASINLVRHR